jgi:hypothetical protein
MKLSVAAALFHGSCQDRYSIVHFDRTEEPSDRSQLGRVFDASNLPI